MFTLPGAWAAATLAWGAIEHESGLRAGGAWDHAVRQLRHYGDWLRR